MVKKQHGYTLIELLVVLALIFVMTGAVVASLAPNRRYAELDKSANEVVAFLRAARQNSVTVLEHPLKPAGSGIYPSYGVMIDTANPGELVMYTDCVPDDDGSNAINSGDTFNYLPTNCDGDAHIASLNLEHGHRIQGISVDASNDPGNLLAYDEYHALFIRPEPQLWHVGRNGGTGAYSFIDTAEVSITIENNAGTETRTVYLNSVGLISVQ